MRKKRKGFGLLEIVIVIIVMAIIYGVSTGSVKQVQKARIDTTAQTLQLFAGDMDAAISQIGLLELSTTAGADTPIAEYLHMLEDEYLSFTFDMATLSIKAGGFEVRTSDLRDGFEQPFLCYMAVLKEDKRVILASAGTDTVFSSDTYSTGDFDDDIIIIVKERK